MAELQLRLAIEKEIAQRMLGMCDSSTSNSTDVLIEEYEACGVVIPEGELLKGVSQQMSTYPCTLYTSTSVDH